MRPLDAGTTARLRAQQLTYRRPEGAAWPGMPTPEGFHHLSRTVPLRTRDLDRAATDLLSWRVHERAGLSVAASHATASVGAVVLLRLGLGPASIRIPCRVVQVLDEPDRRGFAYGTLPGHPETGEELFLLERDADGALSFTVAGFSRHATLLARVGAPVSGAVQRLMIARYLAAPDELAT